MNINNSCNSRTRNAHPWRCPKLRWEHPQLPAQGTLGFQVSCKLSSLILSLRAIDAQLNHRLFVPNSFSTCYKVWKWRKKKKMWSTKLAVLLVEQITSAREQIVEFWDSDMRFPKQMICVQVKNFMVLLMEKQSQVYTKRSKSSPKDSALQFPSDLPCANTHGLAVVSDHILASVRPGPEGSTQYYSELKNYIHAKINRSFYFIKALN